MKLHQSRAMIFVKQVGVFEHDSPDKYSPDFTYIRLKEARARYQWLRRLNEVTFAPLMFNELHKKDNCVSYSLFKTRHFEKIRLNRLSRRRNRQHIADEDYDFRRVRVNRWYFE